MLPRLFSCAAPPTPPQPLHNHAPNLCDDQIRRGRQPWQRYEGQPARSAARQPAPSPAASRQLPASSLQAVNRQPSTSSLQPSPERRERPSNRSERSSRLLTRPARGKRLQAPQPFSHPMRGPNQCGRSQNPAIRHPKSYQHLC